MLNLKVTFRK